MINSFLESIINFIEVLKNFLWSGPLLIILLVIGVYLTIAIRGLQFRSILKCFELSFFNQGLQATTEVPSNNELVNSGNSTGLSVFEAMMTALAGAIGTGNIAGISTAIAIGGAGALFWMWVVAALGMATAYAESLLAIKYRLVNNTGELCGGPMYYLYYRLNLKKTGLLYAVLVVIVAITLGCLVQSHSVVDAITEYYAISKVVLGIFLAGLIGIVIIGGVKSIGRVAGIIVPFMAVGYLGTSIYILLYHYQNILPSLRLIFTSAFSGQAAVGGFVGSTIWLAMQNGAQYGIFANEAGLGSLAIAAASAKTNSGVEQGMRSIAGVFLSTMVICTLTGLVLVTSGVLGSVDANGVIIKGSRLVMLAFSTVDPMLRIIVIFSLAMFAITTTLAWAYYGEKSIEYLCGTAVVVYYRWFYVGFILIGALLKLDFVWSVANLSTGLMCLPNLLGISLLVKEIKLDTKNYLDLIKN